MKIKFYYKQKNYFGRGEQLSREGLLQGMFVVVESAQAIFFDPHRTGAAPQNCAVAPLPRTHLARTRSQNPGVKPDGQKS